MTTTKPYRLFAPTSRFIVPTTFLDDHVSRDLDVDDDGNVFLWRVRTAGSTTHIDVTLPGLLELFSDAEHYSTLEVEYDDAFGKSIRSSARSTVKSIRRQFPEVDVELTISRYPFKCGRGHRFAHRGAKNLGICPSCGWTPEDSNLDSYDWKSR